jgi:hypothetical protein
MAEEYLENPRRAPRVRVRCAAAITPAAGTPLRASSEDVGPHGCQLVSPLPFAKGTLLQVDLASQETREVLRAAGTVAWCSPQPPWRLGLAFTPATRPAATKFFDKLVAARPGLANWRRIPDKLSLDAMVWLAAPPTRVVDFTAEELVMLRAVGSGATIYELRARLKDRWPTGQRAFFSLLSSGSITLTRSASASYQSWMDLLERLEADLAPSGAPARIPPAGPPAPPFGSPIRQTGALPIPPATTFGRPTGQTGALPLPPVPTARPHQPTHRPGPPAAAIPPATLDPAPPEPPPPPSPTETAPPPLSVAGRLAEVRNDGSAGLDRELDLEALDPGAAEGAPLELEELAPVELVEEIPPLEIVGEDPLAEQADWPVEPAPAPDPYAPWPEPPPGKPRGRA